MPTKRRKELHQRAKKIVYLNIVLNSSGSGGIGSGTASVEISSNENVVKGNLEIESKADILIHGILLTIHGNVWTEITSCPSPNGEQKYSSSIFVQSSYILGKGSGTIVLTHGKHSLPFTFCLPQHLPSSFEGAYGSINYLVTAQLHTDNERNDDMNRISHPLQVRRFLDLSQGVAYGNAISIPSSIERPQKTIRTALVPKPNLKFIFKVQKTGFAVGEIVPFVLDVFNPERRKLSSMSVILLKKTVYGDLKYNIDVFDELAEVITSTIDDHKSTLTWIGSLHVPANVVPTHSVIASVPKKKPIFSHRYLLRAKLVPQAGTCVIGDLPIVIGTSKYECRFRRHAEHCSRAFAVPPMREIMDRPSTIRRQSSLPPSYSQSMFGTERRTSLETPYYTYVDWMMLEKSVHFSNDNVERSPLHYESEGLRELLQRPFLVAMIFILVVLIVTGAIRLTRVSFTSTIESFHTYVESESNLTKKGFCSWIIGERGCAGSFKSFWKKLPHRFWSFYIESLLVPSYRKEWGKYRSWSHRSTNRPEKPTHIKKLIRIQKQMRKHHHNALIGGKQAKQCHIIPHNHAHCRRVRINVSGVRYETQLRTLERFPDTLLGDPKKRIQFYDPVKEEYYFDRNRYAFEAILYFYQSGGRFRRPENVQADVLVEDAQFYQLSQAVIDQFRIEEGLSPQNSKHEIVPKGLLRRKLWLLFDFPESSLQAAYIAVLSIGALFLSIACFCVETIEELELKPELGAIDNTGRIVRFLSCPFYGKFLKNPLNIIDLIAVMPFLILTISPSASRLMRDDNVADSETSVSATDSLYLLRLVRVVRVFRIFKLSRHSKGLKILGKTLKASLNELLLLIFFILLGVILFSSAMYFAEVDHPRTQFDSIPGGFWWALITITTVGFGDVVPVTVVGKVVGSLCAVAGVLTIALPVPVIVSNFNFFYHQAIDEGDSQWININHVEACPYRPAGGNTMPQKNASGKLEENMIKTSYSSDEEFGS